MATTPRETVSQAMTIALEALKEARLTFGDEVENRRDPMVRELDMTIRRLEMSLDRLNR